MFRWGGLDCGGTVLRARTSATRLASATTFFGFQVWDMEFRVGGVVGLRFGVSGVR